MAVSSPWGQPSSAVHLGEIGGLPVVFIPRHGGGHVYSPGGINYRANIDVLKRVGVTDHIGLGMRQLEGGFAARHLCPRRSIHRPHLCPREKFFRPGLVAHVALPIQSALKLAGRHGGQSGPSDWRNLYGDGRTAILDAGGIPPYRLGMRVIGMTNMPEAKLAREAELCYATVAMVTDYDCWHDMIRYVDIADILRVMKENSEKAGRLIARLAADFPREHEPCPLGSDRALEHAIITAPEARDPALVAKLERSPAAS